MAGKWAKFSTEQRPNGETITFFSRPPAAAKGRQKKPRPPNKQRLEKDRSWRESRSSTSASNSQQQRRAPTSRSSQQQPQAPARSRSQQQQQAQEATQKQQAKELHTPTQRQQLGQQQLIQQQLAQQQQRQATLSQKEF